MDERMRKNECVQKRGIVQGKAHDQTFLSNPDLAKWFSMRPLVLCDDNVMTFTASGEGSAYLLVNRGKTFESLK